MGSLSKKAYKGLPVGIKVRKPHYYYQDFLEVFNDNTEKYVELREFEGLDYSFNRSKVTFDEKVLWNGYTFPGCERLLAPYSDGDKTVYNTTVGNIDFDNGVASGFSVNNYLTISNKTISDITQFELLTKVKINDNIAADSPIVCKSDAIQTLYVNKFKILSIWDGNEFFGGSTELNTTDWYWVKTILVGNEYKAYLLKDENYTIDTLPEINEWSLEVTTTSNIWSGSILNIGRGDLPGDLFFYGSIDISQTYIKVNDEMFWQPEESIVPNVPNYLTSVDDSVISARGCLDNITDVAEERVLTAFVKDDEILLSENNDDKVGYTWANKVTIPQHEVVPVYKVNYNTIGSVNYDADFNASNFSASNYLVSKDIYKLNEYSSWSIESKVKINTLGKYQFWCHGVVAFGLDNSNKIHVWCNNYDVVSSNTLQTNTWYWVKLEFTSAEFFTGGVFRLYYKTSETDDWTECGNSAITTTLTAENYIYMGINPNNTSEPLYGIIDMKLYKVYGNGVLICEMLEKV